MQKGIRVNLEEAWALLLELRKMINENKEKKNRIPEEAHQVEQRIRERVHNENICLWHTRKLRVYIKGSCICTGPLPLA